MRLFGIGRTNKKETVVGGNELGEYIQTRNGRGSALAERNLHTTPVEPAEAVRRINKVVKIIQTEHPSSLALLAYAVALSAHARIIKRLNENPEVAAPVYFEDVSGLPAYTCMQADLVSYCHRFEPEPLHKAVLDSFSGWTRAGVQGVDGRPGLEGCRCPGDPVTIHLEIMLKHTHQVVDDKLVIEQSLGIKHDGDNKDHGKAHLENHYSGFTEESDREDILIVASSKASIELVTGEYGLRGHQFAQEATRHANEIDIQEWRSLLTATLNSLAPAEQPEEVWHDETNAV